MINLQKHVSLAPLTTFHIGGPARIFIEAYTDAEVEEAIAHVRVLNLPLHILGGGSNILVPDDGVEGVVLKVASHAITFEDDGDDVLLIADAGTAWKKIVDAAIEHCVFGIENLAGVPGTIGGAAVQNIGSYGAELADIFEYADVINSTTGVYERINRTKAMFAYRTSFFKQHREYIVLHVALRLSKNAVPNLAYPDLVRAGAEGTPLSTPIEIARAIRAIRTTKFPRTDEGGTAGSFFKNPIISRELADSLAQHFPGLPAFPQAMLHRTRRGADTIKISLAWLLDHVLSLKGFSKGNVRLYEKQPLVVVASAGATAAEVDAFACEIAERVSKATGIMIEREVETFGA